MTSKEDAAVIAAKLRESADDLKYALTQGETFNERSTAWTVDAYLFIIKKHIAALEAIAKEEKL